MNIPRDPWEDFAEAFADLLNQPITAEQMDEMADDYQRQQIATAQSEAAWDANMKEYNK